MDVLSSSETACRQASIGYCMVKFKKSKRSLPKAKKENNLKSNKINRFLNFKFLLKKLTEYNLFPHKIKLETTNQTSPVHYLSFSHAKTNLDNLISTKLEATVQTTLSSNQFSSPNSSFQKSSSRLKSSFSFQNSLPKSNSLNKLIFLSAILFILLLSLYVDFVYCDHINLPPRFITLPGYSTDIVLTIKEGNSSLNKEIYRIAGEDPNNDRLKFGVIGPIGNDILRIENDVPTANQATIYLRKELDRETQQSYHLTLTLTDGKLAKGSYVSLYILLL